MSKRPHGGKKNLPPLPPRKKRRLTQAEICTMKAMRETKRAEDTRNNGPVVPVYVFSPSLCHLEHKDMINFRTRLDTYLVSTQTKPHPNQSLLYGSTIHFTINCHTFSERRRKLPRSRHSQIVECCRRPQLKIPAQN